MRIHRLDNQKLAQRMKSLKIKPLRRMRSKINQRKRKKRLKNLRSN